VNINKLKEKVQEDALQEWISAGKIGTTEIATGLGKTFLALKALYTMPRNDGKTHLFLAEQVDRQNDLIKDVVKFNSVFKRNVFKDYKLQFQCYQTVRNWVHKDFGLVILDECHEFLTRENVKFYFNNNTDALLGLSATINRELFYSIEGKVKSKGELLDEIIPTCFKYTLNDAQKEGTSRKLNIYVINHQLDRINKTVEAGNAKMKFWQSEAAAYKYWDLLLKKYIYSYPKEGEDIYKFEETKNLKIMSTVDKRNKILYNLHSKTIAIKELLKQIEGKSIIFGNSINALQSITPNVISSKQSQAENEAIRKKFDEGKIDNIASWKKLEQGANLDDLDNCIIHSYYSVEGKIIQRLGRLRQNGEKVGNVFVFITENTQEEVWFKKAFENLTDFNIIQCESIEDCIKQYKENAEL